MAFLFYKFTGTVTFQWVRIVIAAFGDQQTIKRSQCSEKALQTSSSPPGRFDSSSFEPTSVFADRNDTFRSEEHTSELQSLMRTSYDVFCLKKTKKQTAHIIPTVRLSTSTI